MYMYTVTVLYVNSEIDSNPNVVLYMQCSYQTLPRDHIIKLLHMAKYLICRRRVWC